ncbi:MAG: hypothetical protein A2029_09260 [Chloroflexi bacterium RBG_19FT_COMBO_47_9]|nr:MAG: hypothetical protein A2029_09260 [Chloroflexi bacterium RBG_19FT_COMBO_47_9]
MSCLLFNRVVLTTGGEGRDAISPYENLYSSLCPFVYPPLILEGVYPPLILEGACSGVINLPPGL